MMLEQVPIKQQTYIIYNYKLNGSILNSIYAMQNIYLWFSKLINIVNIKMEK